MLNKCNYDYSRTSLKQNAVLYDVFGPAKKTIKCNLLDSMKFGLREIITVLTFNFGLTRFDCIVNFHNCLNFKLNFVLFNQHKISSLTNVGIIFTL